MLAQRSNLSVNRVTYKHRLQVPSALRAEEAGLIEATKLSNHSGISWKPKRLTWAGHEFLEASRDESRWDKAKVIIKEKGGGMVLSVLQNLLVKLANQAVLGS